MTNRPERSSRVQSKAVRVHKGGRRKPTGPVYLVPPEALERRGEVAGMPTDLLKARNKVVMSRIGHDGAMVSALGRLMWQFDRQGRRHRRMVSYGPQAGREPLISDDMEVAAVAFQRLWFSWCRTSGMPRRSAQALDLSVIRVDGGVTPFVDGGTAGSAEDAERDAEVATARLEVAWDALKRCPASVLVIKVIETILIDDVLPDLLLERPQALEALRTGLLALDWALIHKSSRNQHFKGSVDRWG